MGRKHALIPMAVAAALGISAAEVTASSTYQFDVRSFFSAFNNAGTTELTNIDYNSEQPPSYHFRTAISGTLSYDRDSGLGTMRMVPFSFFGGGLWVSNPIRSRRLEMVRADPGTCCWVT